MLGNREIYRRPLFSNNEIFCGPHCQTKFVNQKVETLTTPTGIYDIRSILSQIPEEQSPEIILVKADSTRANFPVNLGSFHGPKVLVVGNTQHLHQPIRTLLEYAVQEKFDFIISDHKGHHLHYFYEAGFQNICFIPALNITPYRQKQREKKQHQLTFIGQTGGFHPYRSNILRKLRRAEYPLFIQQTSPQQAAEIYSKSLINLNISLNGDMNLRFFEILSSGGFLLTDRLSPESGIFNFFSEGKHFLMFDGYNDLQEKITHYLDHSDQAIKIAQQGHDCFWKDHKPEIKANLLIDYISTGTIDAIYQLNYDQRVAVRKQPIQGGQLLKRCAIYEYLQELHLNHAALTVQYWPEVSVRTLLDLIDLPRVTLLPHQSTSPQKSNPTDKETVLFDKITESRYKQNKAIHSNSITVLIITQSELLGADLEKLLKQQLFYSILVTDITDHSLFSPEHEYTQLLNQLGFTLINNDPVVYQWLHPIKWGEHLFSSAQYSEARLHFQRILTTQQDQHEVINNLGAIAYTTQNFEDAELYFRQALSYDRKNPNYLENYITVLLENDKYNLSCNYLKELISITPDKPDTLYKYALCLFKTNQYQSALNVIENSLKSAATYEAKELQKEILKAVSNDIRTTQKKSSKYNLKILVINNLYPPQELGGYGRLISDFTNILSNRGHHTMVLSSDSSYLGEAPLHEPGVQRSLFLYGGWKNGKTEVLDDKSSIRSVILKNVAAVRQSISEYQPDCVLLGNIDFLGKAVLEEILNWKIPVIHHVGNENPGYQTEFTPKSKHYHIATASDWVLKKIKGDGYPIISGSTVYPGAKTDEFFLHLTPSYETLRICYASIVLPYKGPHVLIDALKIVYQEGYDFTCEIAGPTTNQDFVNDLKDFVKVSGLNDRIKFLGLLNREELKCLFGRSNMLIFPSVFEEPFGISQVEAMASGIVVLTSGTGGTREIIEHQQSGIIFQSENPTSLANEIINLYKNQKKWQQLALAGQQRAVKSFDINISVTQLEQQFFKMLKTSK